MGRYAAPRYIKQFGYGNYILVGNQGKETYSSRIQLPTDTPPQLMPPTKLPAKLSRRCLSLLEPVTVIGFVPFPHCVMLAPIESLRTAFALYTMELGTLEFAAPAGLSAVEARWRAEVRFEAWWPGGETDVFRDTILMGGVGPSIVRRSGGEEGKSGKVESSRSGSNRAEVWKIPMFGCSAGFRCQEKYKSRSRSAVRDLETAAKPTGVPMGVVSRVEERSWSLEGGEYWRGGGVSENWGIR